MLKYWGNYWSWLDTIKLSFSAGSDKIPGGSHTWPFQFTLPRNIPSSFEGTVGWVRYSLKVTADIPFGFDDKNTLYFSVNDLDDLNYNEEAKVTHTNTNN